MEFEWDAVKERINIHKHSVSFSEAVESFSDSYGIQLTDLYHSQNEKRFYWIGKTLQGRIITVRFTQRENCIRIIGAAEWRKFRRLYETTKIK